MRLWVQLVEIIYSKASRGAPGATVRNQLPRAFAIHGGPEPFYSEHWKCLEDAGYAPRLVHSRSADELPRRDAQLTCKLGPASVKLGLRRPAWSAGQPRRRDVPTAVELRPGQTARLITNHRHSGYRGWHYTEATYNVALGDDIPPDVFLLGEPTAIHDERANLF
jgi:hypothetical protein